MAIKSGATCPAWPQVGAQRCNMVPHATQVVPKMPCTADPRRPISLPCQPQEHSTGCQMRVNNIVSGTCAPKNLHNLRVGPKKHCMAIKSGATCPAWPQVGAQRCNMVPHATQIDPKMPCTAPKSDPRRPITPTSAPRAQHWVPNACK